MYWKKFFIATLMLFGFVTCTTENVFAQENSFTVTGIAEVYGDGEKISQAVLNYPKTLNAKNISAKNFEVAGKVIESLQVEGNKIILNFAYQNTSFDGNFNQKPGNENRREKNFGKGDAPKISNRKLPDLNFSVKQVTEIFAEDGTKFLPTEKVADKISAPVIEKFQQFIYTDPATGNQMPYNLFLPEGYDANKKYPLLFFVADASANIDEVKTPLFQGNGATSFAEKNFQEKNPCIILAPQYTAELVEKLGMMTTDENVWTDGLTLVTNLLFDVVKNYSVDENRIYGTGQSQGGMTNIAISDKYPELFAGQILVACQWNVDEMEILKDKNLWIVVCEGDTKAFPEMNKAVSRWESLGAKVAKNPDFWNSKESVAELNKKIQSLENENAKINYTVFAGGNHMYTWSFAYNLDELKNWLFRQKKS